jgi:2'-5' RNA ligase
VDRTHRPFITDPARLGDLAGQRYVVLRPTGEVEQVHRDVQGRVRARLGDLPAAYPNPHVTLIGFPGGERQAIGALVEAWARGVPALELEIERVNVFPHPFRIVIAQVMKTARLAGAMTAIHEEARRRGLPDWPPGTVPPPEEWVFHMSVAYCRDLADSDWQALSPWAERLEVASARCTVTEAELVVFDGGVERLGGRFRFAA